METILITGASGLIGRHLIPKLKEKGFRVITLSRYPDKSGKTESYYWNPESNEIDTDSIKNADYIIHLAGANIGEKRWTKQRKQEIIDSRAKTSLLLLETIKKLDIKPKAFISASAIGFYGAVTSEKIFTETDQPENDFLGKVSILWENAAKEYEQYGIRTIVLRLGIVLSPDGGALSAMASTIKKNLGAFIGNGKQYMPWIHIQDLCDIFVKTITDSSMHGIFNAVAPEHQTNKTFTKTLAGVLQRPLWPIPVPAFLLRLYLGEMACLVTKGSRVSSEKLEKTGLTFRFPKLKEALEECFKQPQMS